MEKRSKSGVRERVNRWEGVPHRENNMGKGAKSWGYTGFVTAEGACAEQCEMRLERWAGEDHEDK